MVILLAVLCLAASSSGGSQTAFDANFGNELTSVAGTACSYDANGNITGDGTRYYSYDDENQLTQVIWGSGNYRTDFAYDGLGRVRKRTEYYYSAGAWTWNSEVRFIYDGRRVIQERNSSNTPTVAYTRGLDLSGSFEGAFLRVVNMSI